MIKYLVCFLILAAGTFAQTCDNDKVIFCYYSSWAVYRPTFGVFNISNIDPFLCTHYVFSFAGLNLDGKLMSLDPGNDLPENGGMQQFYHFRMMKEQNPCIKVLLSIGGWDEGSEKYSVMVDTAESRKIFIEHALRYLIYYGFDGIDVDWEYPTQRGGIPSDKENFGLLLKELKERLGPRGKLVSTAVGAGIGYIEEAYDVPVIAEYADYVLLMTYDYQRHDVTTYMAPLRINQTADVNSGSIVESVEKWILLGCPPSKLVLGVQTSGRSYTLENATNNGLGAPIKGPGDNGLITGLPGFVAYYEMCFMLASQTGWIVSFNESPHASVYATRQNQWITFEDTRTIKLKVEYAVQQQLAGVLVWTIDTDDFYPLCGTENPLQSMMRETLGLPTVKSKKVSKKSISVSTVNILKQLLSQ